MSMFRSALLTIRQYFLGIGGLFTLSDDSHGISQVGLNFAPAIHFLEGVGVARLHYLKRQQILPTARKTPLLVESVELQDICVDHHPSS